MNRTIPEIAEELRRHINNDNDAERLICEHILPLVRIDYDEVKDLQDRVTELEEEIENLNNSDYNE